MGLLSGFAKINDFGVKVLEAGAEPPIPVSIDKSRRPAVSKRKPTSREKRSQQKAIYGGVGESDHRGQSSRRVGAGEK